MLKIKQFSGSKLISYSPSFRFLIDAALHLNIADGISVFMSGLNKKEISNLSKVHNVRAIFLQDCKDYMNFDFLQKLTCLETLTIDGDTPDLNLDYFPDLRHLSFAWRASALTNIKSSALTELDIWKFNQIDINPIKDFSQLRRLSIHQSSIESLSGIERLQKLDDLSLFLNPKLEDLSSLSGTSIKSITIENSKNIQDYSFLESCENLEEIKIHNSSPILSLSFVSRLRKLKSLRFVGTKVIDGDMSPLLNLDDFFFENMNHYSHKYEDIA